MDIFYRLLITTALIALGALAYSAWNRWQLSRLGRPAIQRAPGLEQWLPGVPAILYFTTPDCAPCRTVQRPAIERLARELADDLQVIEIDASTHTAIADYWGVLSVPTTFVLDESGQPVRVNHGVANAGKLKRQLEEVRGRSNKEEVNSQIPTPNYQVE